MAFEVKLSEDESAALETKRCARHVDSAKPIPCQIYQNADPGVRVVKGMPDVNGTPMKCYVLAGARSVALNRPMPGRTLVRISFPGKTELGFINTADEPAVKRWWDATEPHLKAELTEMLFATVTRADAPRPMAEVETKSEAKLNPMDPSEAGVRRRSLEDF